MKKGLLLFLTVILSNFCFAKKECKVDSMRIITTHYLTSSFAPVYCENMLKELEIVGDTLILEKSLIFTLLNDLSKSKRYNSEMSGIDTRAIVYIYYRNTKVRKLCLSSTDVFSDDGQIKVFENGNFMDFVFPIRKKFLNK